MDGWASHRTFIQESSVRVFLEAKRSLPELKYAIFQPKHEHNLFVLFLSSTLCVKLATNNGQSARVVTT